MGKVTKFMKRTAIAALIFGGYSLFYNQIDTNMIRSLSQKKGEAIIGVDFEAYKPKEIIGITIPKNGDSVNNVKGKVIENWAYISGYEIANWMKKSYSNTLSFTPYCSTFIGDEKKEKEEKRSLERITLEKGDDMLKDLFGYIQKPDKIILRVKGDKKVYEGLNEKDPLTTVTRKIAKNVTDNEDRVIIELEAPDDGDYKAHNDRIKLIKYTNPKLKVATTLDKKEGYDEKARLWDPEKSRQYWENSDVIIIEDYFSDINGLRISIEKFKKAAKGKQVWVRVVTGSKRINEKGMRSLEGEVEDYENALGVVLKYADGCLANDSNGIWLFSSSSYDNSERLDATKKLYKQTRKIKIERSATGYN